MLEYNALPFFLSLSPSVERAEIATPEWEGLRIYKDGKIGIPSVTTILGYGKEKHAILANWRKKFDRLLVDEGGMGYREAQRYYSLASKRGTSLHEMVEKYHENRIWDPVVEVPDYSIEYLLQIQSILEKVGDKVLKEPELRKTLPHNWHHVKDFLDKKEGTILAQELFVFCKDLNIAGTLDLLYEDSLGRVVVADYKFTGYGKGSHNPLKRKANGWYSWENPSDAFHEKWLQLTAYADALNYLIKDKFVTHMELISVHPDGIDHFLVPIDRDARMMEIGTETLDYSSLYQEKLKVFFDDKQ